jgi:hypothetical protein
MLLARAAPRQQQRRIVPVLTIDLGPGSPDA